jgi:hypothetical protein
MNVDRVVPIVSLALVIGGIGAALLGWRFLSGSRGLQFHNLRRDRLRRGWRWIAAGAALLLAGAISGAFGRQVGQRMYPPTPTVTMSPTVTLTATLTLTPTITLTPRETHTPSPTPRPTLPEAIAVLVRQTVTPPVQAVFSPIVVASRLDESRAAVDGSGTWTNPPARLFGAFTYDYMVNGVQWTALWVLDGEVVCFDRSLWDGGSGGRGYTECEPERGWMPGKYAIQLFLGDQWWTTASFEILEVATATPSPSAAAP